MNLKLKQTAIGAGAAALVVLLLWYVLLWSPETSRLKAAKKNLSVAQSQVVSAQEQLALLQAEKPKVAAERKVFAQLVTALPNGPSLDQMFTTIRQAASASGVIVNNLGTPTPTGWGTLPGETSTAAAPGGSGPEFISVSLGVTGTPSQVMGLVTHLDHEPRIYVVTSLSFGSMKSQQVTVTLDAFFVSGATADPVFPGPAQS